MLLFNVTYTMLPGKREEFVKAVRESGILKAVREEEGCLGYSYYLPEEEDGTLLLVERWTDAQAQKAHLATPHMAKLAEIKERCVTDTRMIAGIAEE